MPNASLIFLGQVGKLGNDYTTFRTPLTTLRECACRKADQFVFRVSLWMRAHDFTYFSKAARPVAALQERTRLRRRGGLVTL